MAKGLLITESMSGWIQLNDDQQREFSFTITAFTPKVWSLTTQRAFEGIATISGVGEITIEGVLVIRPMGPEYNFNMVLPDVGALNVSGRKNYSLPRLIYSMTHCPLLVRKDGKEYGRALLAYRDSVLAFPFKALSLSETPEWYSAVSESFA